MNTLVRRLTRIRNTTNNLGWGHCDYTPFMKTDKIEDTVEQCVLVVGHNVYRKTNTMFLEKFKDGSYRVSLMHESEPDEVIVEGFDMDFIVQRVIVCLRDWFPEIRKKVLA